jgi:hypothetical protein
MAYEFLPFGQLFLTSFSILFRFLMMVFSFFFSPLLVTLPSAAFSFLAACSISLTILWSETTVFGILFPFMSREISMRMRCECLGSLRACAVYCTQFPAVKQ